MMVEIRRHFHEQLEDLESRVQRMGVAAHELFRRALETTWMSDCDFDAVIASDDEVDAMYLDIEGSVIEMFALQGPVASDLRLLASMLHINLHLERVADMGVNVAKIAKAAVALPPDPIVVRHLQEMGTIALAMLSTAMDALARRDVNLARELPLMDDPLDELNRGMLAEVLNESRDRAMLEWGIHMHIVSRQIERVGDHAVDIGEQVAYMVTGQFQEFTDASHPELERRIRLTESEQV
jgi:phosphate transport system protein